LIESSQAAVTALYKSVGRRLGLLPIQKLLQELRRREVDLGSLRTLSPFGGTGERVERHYAPLVAHLEVWEIDPEREPALRRNLPNARVKITDSYEEIGRTEKKFDFIFIDTHMSPDAGRIEHFDLFPSLFRIVSDDALLAFNVIPEADKRTRRGYPNLFNDAQLSARRSFYRTEHPERTSLDELAAHYRELCEENGFTPEWHFSVRRWERRGLFPMPMSLYFLVLKLKRA